jgi:serine/threonine-protein kinase RsbT
MMTDIELNVSIKKEDDILNARHKARRFVIENMNFSPLERMYVLTTVSELARNIYKYANEGKMLTSVVQSPNGKKGIKLVFSDNGPGISDIEKAMERKSSDKYHAGMGLGLIGSKKLADEFDIKSTVGEGTVVTWIRWER